MVRLNKKAFMKTVEAILIILFFASIYQYITQKVYTGTTKTQRSPEMMVYDLINTLEKTGLINTYLENGEIREIDNIIEYLLPTRYQHTTVVEYSTNMKIKNLDDQNKNNLTLATMFLFPKYVDKDSVNIFTTKANLDKYVKFNWYEKKITLINRGNALNNINLKIPNITLTSNTTINNKSIKVLMDNKFVNFDIINWTQIDNSTNILTSIVINVPKIDRYSTKNCYIFYSNSSFNESSTTTLPSYQEIEFLEYNSTSSSLAEIYFYLPSLKANESKNVFVSYSIGTNYKAEYNKILENYVNNTNIEITHNTKYIDGSAPISKDISKEDTYAIEKWVPLSWGYAKVQVNIW